MLGHCGESVRQLGALTIASLWNKCCSTSDSELYINAVQWYVNMKRVWGLCLIITAVSAYQDSWTHRTPRNRPGELAVPDPVPDGYDDAQMEAWILAGNSPDKNAVLPQPNKPLRLATLATRWRNAVVALSVVIGVLFMGTASYHALGLASVYR